MQQAPLPVRNALWTGVSQVGFLVEASSEPRNSNVYIDLIIAMPRSSARMPGGATEAMGLRVFKRSWPGIGPGETEAEALRPEPSD